MKTFNDEARLRMILRICDRIKKDFETASDQILIQPLMQPGNDEWHDVLQMQIDPATLGPFAPAITEMRVNVTAGISVRGNGHLQYEYEYHHPDGGRNGKTVEIVLNKRERNER
jgi:hypothetical protein